jgi:hypothetical protein
MRIIMIPKTHMQGYNPQPAESEIWDNAGGLPAQAACWLRAILLLRSLLLGAFQGNVHLWS